MNTHDLPNKSLQEVFDFVCSKLIEQGRGSMGFDPTLPNRLDEICLYRSEAGKCAAGHLIADEDYQPAFENITITNLVTNAVGRSLGLGDVSWKMMQLIGELQTAHDVSAQRLDFVDQFKLRARGVAHRYDLNTEVLGAE